MNGLAIRRHGNICNLFIERCPSWNGNKEGLSGTYPLSPQPGDPGYTNGTYFGHNIAALSVDAIHGVENFDFNHNKIFNSSMEHAEARLVRHSFSTAIRKTFDVSVEVAKDDPKNSYTGMLKGTTMYTTLESYTQCVGIAQLASIDEVVYLQTDPYMHHIGNVVWDLHKETPLGAPKHHAASIFGFPYQTALDSAYADFKKTQDEKTGTPFFISPENEAKYSSSIASFLCTQTAFGIFKAASEAFDRIVTPYLDNSIVDIDPENRPIKFEGNALKALQLNSFVHYAVENGYRGTPHR